MFQGATSFNSDISEGDMSGLAITSSMLCRVTSFNGDISEWDVPCDLYDQHV